MQLTAGDARVTVIGPSHRWGLPDWRELWDYRELLYFLTWRDIKVRYKQTALGAGWAILQPLLSMLVFSLFFGRLAKIPSDGLPYPIFAYTALIAWQFFAYALTNASTSLVANERIISKVYFPRMLAPMASVLSGLVDFALAFVVFTVMLVFYGIPITWAVLWLPVFTLLAVLTALGVSLWLSALDVQYRDVRYTLPFLTQIWLFATPVVYPASMLPEPWHTLFGLNPMAGVVEGFRWALLGKAPPPGLLLVVSSVAVIVVLLSGVLYFRRMEETFADVI
jgi:lipopolysaccharide transport system permease protein